MFTNVLNITFPINISTGYPLWWARNNLEMNIDNVMLIGSDNLLDTTKDFCGWAEMITWPILLSVEVGKL